MRHDTGETGKEEEEEDDDGESTKSVSTFRFNVAAVTFVPRSESACLCGGYLSREEDRDQMAAALDGFHDDDDDDDDAAASAGETGGAVSNVVDHGGSWRGRSGAALQAAMDAVGLCLWKALLDSEDEETASFPARPSLSFSLSLGGGN
jgi:hypothetical protein